MKKLIISSINELRFISHDNIIFCKSDNCYTNICLLNGEEIVVCKSLSKISAQLDSSYFIRVHQSYLINKECIELIDKKMKVLELRNKMQIPFTTSVKELLHLITPELSS